ncbi:MAG: 1,4-alpha-glucan branching protein GlgB [Clostridia bacterium]|nr:1,4-alpha-glucan branching protein GlgB [Clostridia bacterium]
MKRFFKEASEAVYLFNQGENYYSYKTFGAHFLEKKQESKVRFVVWAPSAKAVYLVGAFNEWMGDDYPLEKDGRTGVWAGLFAALQENQLYKYRIHTADGRIIYKSDPFGRSFEHKPGTATRLYREKKFPWADKRWLNKRKKTRHFHEPMNIYELHLSSWKHDGSMPYPNYRDLAQAIVPYVTEMGYSHIELLPISEHPFDGSWGYQQTGYYGITSRYGTPEDFKYFVNHCHQNNIGVILDWVPCHFCKDEHGLQNFDGQPLFEHEYEDLAENAQWGTRHFDYTKGGVRSFLISNALFFFEEFHIDGLRVDAVAFMLYDPREGRREEVYPPGVNFIQSLNKAVFKYYPDVLMIAEESSAWPMVTGPVYDGGLGFNYKWNMGWMNDMLKYMSMDTIYRKHHQNLITFSLMYAFSEQFILPISHDEVVHGKKSLLDKMPGSYEEKFANLRMFIAYMYAHPGKKLLFMGSELAQFIEWNYERPLDWFLLEYPLHRGAQQFMKTMNQVYKEESALYALDHQPRTFQWIDHENHDYSVISFLRKGEKKENHIIVICNFGTHYFDTYDIGVPMKGAYERILDSSEKCFSDVETGTRERVITSSRLTHNFEQTITITLPPLTTLYYKFSKN